ncbi:MAG: hypothetical protein M1818_002533 [Claussenomyces sp. TS43310]|nr:MAG: hypothetical protein M1818_002533 [Claussenomyces sp. TS43310]
MGVRDCFGLALSYILLSIVRVIQLALALTVCGLYGVDLQRARDQGKYQDGKWVYAEVVGGLSAFAAVLYLIPLVLGIPFVFVCDVVLFIFWVALFGVFGNMYIGENPEGDSGIQRMKNAVWVDLVSMLLWLATAVIMGMYWTKHRGTRTLWTGRATV